MSGCASPVSPATLLGYWLGELPAEAEAAVEEHLLGCAACAAELERLLALREAVQRAVRTGASQLVVTQALVERLASEGVRVREYRVSPGESVRCTVGAEDQLVVSRLRAPLQGVSRLDLVRIGEAGEARQNDIPFDAAAGEVLVCPPMEALRGLGETTQRMRLLSVDEQGERAIAEYTFHHSPAQR